MRSSLNGGLWLVVSPADTGLSMTCLFVGQVAIGDDEAEAGNNSARMELGLGTDPNGLFVKPKSRS